MNPRLRANLPQNVSGIGSQRHVFSGPAEIAATDSKVAGPIVHVQVAAPRCAQDVRYAYFVRHRTATSAQSVAAVDVAAAARQTTAFTFGQNAVGEDENGFEYGQDWANRDAVVGGG